MKRIAMAIGLAFIVSHGASAQTSEQLVKGATDTSNVLNYGMGYNLNRFSTLNQINKDTVKFSYRCGITVLPTIEARNRSRWSIRASSM
jgi:glucose dehydrogenase